MHLTDRVGSAEPTRTSAKRMRLMSLMSDCELGGLDHAAADVENWVRGIHDYVSKSCLFKLSDVKLECHGRIPPW